MQGKGKFRDILFYIQNKDVNMKYHIKQEYLKLLQTFKINQTISFSKGFVKPDSLPEIKNKVAYQISFQIKNGLEFNISKNSYIKSN